MAQREQDEAAGAGSTADSSSTRMTKLTKSNKRASLGAKGDSPESLILGEFFLDNYSTVQ